MHVLIDVVYFRTGCGWWAGWSLLKVSFSPLSAELGIFVILQKEMVTSGYLQIKNCVLHVSSAEEKRWWEGWQVHRGWLSVVSYLPVSPLGWRHERRAVVFFVSECCGFPPKVGCFSARILESGPDIQVLLWEVLKTGENNAVNGHFQSGLWVCQLCCWNVLAFRFQKMI